MWSSRIQLSCSAEFCSQQVKCKCKNYCYNYYLQNLLKHSLYVVYIEEAFKFIPQQQFIFTTMEDYKHDEVSPTEWYAAWWVVCWRNTWQIYWPVELSQWSSHSLEIPMMQLRWILISYSLLSQDSRVLQVGWFIFYYTGYSYYTGC